MKNATDYAAVLTKLIDGLPAATPIEFPDAGQPIPLVVQSFLMWDATGEKALAAYEKLIESVVDHNDLRVSMPYELLTAIGSRYPQGQLRCERLRATIQHIYQREHGLSLESLAGQGKRDVRKYIESLDGIVPYVSARVLLLGHGVHAMPVDATLRQLLIDHDAVDPDADEAEISQFLTRQIKAADGIDVYWRLQAWADVEGPARAAKKVSKAPSKKKTTKKAATKKKTTKKATTKKKTTSKKTTAKKSTTKKTATKKTSTKKKSTRKTAGADS